MNSSIAVVGVGAIGGAIAADLADLRRHDLLLCSRTPFDTLEVRHREGVSHMALPATTEPRQCKPVDWILLSTKAHQSELAKPWLAALSKPGTVVAALQNGVDHEARLRPLVEPGVEVLPVVVQIPSERTAPGRVVQSHPGMLVVPAGALGDRFAALFAGARTNIKVHADFVTQAWWKLINNAALGGVCALAIRENGIAREPEVRDLVLALMREIVEVGRAEGARLPDDAPEKALNMVLDTAPDHWSSITVDRREGRALEWRVRNAVVCETGRKHGISTPLNDVVTTLLRAADPGTNA